MEKGKAVKNVLVVLRGGKKGIIIEGPNSQGICTAIIADTKCIKTPHYNEIEEIKNERG